ncbi:GNAT family acetyltransferase [Acidisphaera sp. S103]|uniref:GNAT family acetyltransferase n=1 Tax=Acidisphaera sp. S103 TaxID=1747223 RepID=UPI00131B2B20|nr:GNAT family acetyltransferase [Acidisphaera sp. S103]
MSIEAAIREMVDEDAEQVIAIWHASGVARPWNDPVRDLAFARRNPHSTVLVAHLSDRIVATAMVGEDGHRGWVYYVAADPKHQGGGYGRAMMHATEKWLTDRGVWKVQLLVREDNTSVKQFYEHLGYRDTKSVCFQKVIEPVDS